MTKQKNISVWIAIILCLVGGYFVGYTNGKNFEQKNIIGHLGGIKIQARDTGDERVAKWFQDGGYVLEKYDPENKIGLITIPFTGE